MQGELAQLIESRPSDSIANDSYPGTQHRVSLTAPGGLDCKKALSTNSSNPSPLSEVPHGRGPSIHTSAPASSTGTIVHDMHMHAGLRRQPRTAAQGEREQLTCKHLQWYCRIQALRRGQQTPLLPQTRCAPSG